MRTGSRMALMAGLFDGIDELRLPLLLPLVAAPLCIALSASPERDELNPAAPVPAAVPPIPMALDDFFP